MDLSPGTVATKVLQGFPTRNVIIQMVTGILGGGYSTIDARKSGKLTLGPFSNQGVAEGPPDTQTVQVEVEEEPVPHAQQKKKSFPGLPWGKQTFPEHLRFKRTPGKTCIKQNYDDIRGHPLIATSSHTASWWSLVSHSSKLGSWHHCKMII